jgi:hypothetical protein
VMGTSHAVLRRVSLGAFPADVAVDEIRDRVYVELAYPTLVDVIELNGTARALSSVTPLADPAEEHGVMDHVPSRPARTARP